MGALSEVKPCNTGPCDAPCKRVDCAWHAWSEWGTCDKCGGQRKRFRNSITQALCGGTPCSPEHSEETDSCPRKCHRESFCTWDSWEDWGNCDSGCGQGSRTRQRYLKLVTHERSLEDVPNRASNVQKFSIEDQLEALLKHNRGRETGHFQELVVAFAGGGISLVTLL